MINKVYIQNSVEYNKSFVLQPSYKGKYLLDHVCQQLNVTETDYFGLRYVDANGQRVRNIISIILHFSVRLTC